MVESPYEIIEESEETPWLGCIAMVESPYEIIEEREETPWLGCIAMVESPYEIIEESEDNPTVVKTCIFAIAVDNVEIPSESELSKLFSSDEKYQ